MRKILLTFTILGAVLLGAFPARAASYEFKDPEGDATGVGVADGVTPSDDQFDLTKVALSTEKGTFVYAASVKKLAAGTPSNSTGYYFRLSFDYAGGQYWFIVAEDVTGAKSFSLSTRTTPTTTLTCKDCSGLIDRKAGKVVIKASIASLAAAMKQADATKNPLGPGAELTGFEVLAQRQAVRATLTSDTATAPAGVAFTL